MKNTLRPLLLAASLALAWPAFAQQAPGPLPAPATPVADSVLHLNAAASVDVAQDWMSVDFSVTKEGADARVVQAQLKAALDAALQEARKIEAPAGPAQVQVQGGNFALQPRYDAKGRMNGWTGSTQLRVQGRDMAAIAQLVGRIGTMSIASLGYSISAQAREQAETALTAQAIARFRAAAGAQAQAFGQARWSVREVSVGMDGDDARVMYEAAPKLMAARAEAPLPVAAGTDTLTVKVSGTITLGR